MVRGTWGLAFGKMQGPAAGESLHPGGGGKVGPDSSPRGCSRPHGPGAGWGSGIRGLSCRYAVLQRLFPPIPHMKDPIRDNFVHEKMVRPGFCRRVGLGTRLPQPCLGARCLSAGLAGGSPGGAVSTGTPPGGQVGAGPGWVGSCCCPGCIRYPAGGLVTHTDVPHPADGLAGERARPGGLSSGRGAGCEGPVKRDWLFTGAGPHRAWQPVDSGRFSRAGRRHLNKELFQPTHWSGPSP